MNEGILDRALGKLSYEIRINGILWLLVACVGAAAFIVGYSQKAYGVTHTVHDPAAVAESKLSAAEVARAWGQPDQQVPGAQISQGLTGTTCNVYQSKRAILCYVP